MIEGAASVHLASQVPFQGADQIFGRCGHSPYASTAKGWGWGARILRGVGAVTATVVCEFFGKDAEGAFFVNIGIAEGESDR